MLFFLEILRLLLNLIIIIFKMSFFNRLIGNMKHYGMEIIWKKVTGENARDKKKQKTGSICDRGMKSGRVLCSFDKNMSSKFGGNVSKSTCF